MWHLGCNNKVVNSNAMAKYERPSQMRVLNLHSIPIIGQIKRNQI